MAKKTMKAGVVRVFTGHVQIEEVDGRTDLHAADRA